MKVMACPGGNGYYMSTQDAVGGLTITLLVKKQLFFYLKNVLNIFAVPNPTRINVTTINSP